MVKNIEPVRILIGGSPCTYWSIAQNKDNRETKAEGLGWELFRNYLIAKEKFKPDFFLYENNKSAAPPIKEQISKELGVGLQYMNSALVSAQNRERFYAHNILNVEQPVDRGILLKDVLESGDSWKEKSYCLDANYYKATDGTDPFNGRQSGKRLVVAEPVCIAQRGRYEKDGSLFQHYELRKDGKTNVLTTVSKDNLVAEQVNIKQSIVGNINPSGKGMNGNIIQIEGKSITITTNKGEGIKIAQPVRIGTIENNSKTKSYDSQQYRVYSPYGKSVTICGQGGGVGAKTGLYATPVYINLSEYSDVIYKDTGNIEINGKIIYLVVNQTIWYKNDTKHTIKLPDGYYIIRKLSPVECERLQTLPDNYTNGISNSQRYKCIGNGWTAEVIIHILSYLNLPKDTPIEILSMYDGIATGRYCFDKLGYMNITYKAYEIDKYAMQVAMKNYPEIIQCGDAFDVRNDIWDYDKL